MRTVLLLATLALLAPPARAQQQQQPVAAETGVAVPDSGPIAKVEIKGNRRVETDAIKAVIPLKPGDTYDKTKLKNTLLAVWKMGYFSDVQLDVSHSTPPLTGYTLTVIVKEKHVEKGYFLAEVTPSIRPLPNNEVDVVFVINEHAKVTVREVRFVGNKALTTEELKAAMLTTEGTLFSFLTGAGTYREEALQRDEIILQGMYFDIGHIYVKFGKPAIELSPDKRFIYITMTIDEGEPYDVGKIDVAGDLLVPRQQLLSLIITRPGQRFSKSRLQADMQRLLDVYKDKGYAYANVTPDTAVDAEKKTVDLTYAFQKGNLVTIEKIDLVGNNKTRDKVIRREMRINEGDLYNGTAVRLSKQRVTALGFFDNVEINSRRGSGDDKMVLEVSVKEKLTGTFQVGFGFTGGESFFGQAQLAQNNLLGYGHTASLSLQISSVRQLFQLSYLDPYVFDTHWTGSIDLYRSELIFSGFDRQANGGSLTGGYELV